VLAYRQHPPVLRRSGRSREAGRPTDPDAVPVLAGRYRLAGLVGHGATARVWRARDELLDRDVAVKQFHKSDPHDVVEARMAAQVRHPNVVAVHDMVQHRGSGWLVMDYHDGTTLATLIRGGRKLPPPVVTALGQQLLAALRAVHAAGVSLASGMGPPRCHDLGTTWAWM